MTPTEPRSRGVEADVLLPTERELLADSRAYFEANESRFRSREEALVGVIERLVPLITAAEARGRDQERARLAALSPGEAKGPWTVDYDGNDGEAGWWIVSRADGDSLYCLTLRTKGEAEAVAAALNALEPDHA